MHHVRALVHAHKLVFVGLVSSTRYHIIWIVDALTAEEGQGLQSGIELQTYFIIYHLDAVQSHYELTPGLLIGFESNVS